MHYDPLDIRAQEREKADRELVARIQRERDEADVLWLMKQKQGRRFMWRLLAESRVYQNPFDKDPHQHAFNSGTHNFGLRMLAAMNAVCPGCAWKMAKEFQETEVNERRSNERD